MSKLVYLAGPISGLKFGECTEWRNAVVHDLSQYGITGLSPMRGKEYLLSIAKDEPLGPDGDKYKIISPLSTNQGITTRDRWDCQRADVVLMNLVGAKQVSIGTCIEIGWADAARVPIVLAMEDGNPHEHGMVLACAGLRAKTLQEAFHLVVSMLRNG